MKLNKKLIRSIVNAPRTVREKTADGVILTLTGYYNYGNVIQKYALQNALKKAGYNFIAYANVDPINNPTSTYTVPKKVLATTPLRTIKRLIKSQKPYWHVPKVSDIHPDIKKMENLVDFVNSYIWQKPFNIDDRDNYRNYLVGSDQVWRGWYTEENEKQFAGYYFLDFLGDRKTNRVAYAASFGKDTLDGVLSKDFIKYIAPFINKFDAVSVRENSGINLIKRTWGRNDVVEVVDPTLLLSKSDYSAIINRSQVIESSTDPIFYYILDMSKEKHILVEKIAEYRRESASGIHPNDEDILPPVEAWLKGFRDSKFVITDSFHGTVFSIINHTPFIVIGNEGRGLSRILDLVDGLGLNDRLVLEDSLDKFDYTKLKPINWDKVQKLLDKKKRFSSDWLKDHLVK